MKEFLNTSIGRLRLIAFLEGISLLLLVFVAMPLKYYGNSPMMVKVLGPIHGVLFLWFVLNTLRVAVEQKWKFGTTTWKVLLGCSLPFGTFYIDGAVLKKMHRTELEARR